MRVSPGFRSITFFHGSRRAPSIWTTAPSITELSMPVISRESFHPSPCPPNSLSMMEKVIAGSISSSAEPFSGYRERIAIVAGLGMERMNSS